MRRFLPIVLLAVVAVLAGCEPTQREGGQVVILSAIPIMLIGMGFQWMFTTTWKRFDPSIGLDPRPMLKMLGLIGGMFLAVVISGIERDTGEWFGFAVWFVGTSYLSLYFIVMRLGVTRTFRGLLAWAPVVPWVLLLPPAIYFAALGGPERLDDWAQALWIVPGFGGYVAGPMFLILLIEIGVRVFRRAREVEPPLPVAAARYTRSDPDD